MSIGVLLKCTLPILYRAGGANEHRDCRPSRGGFSSTGASAGEDAAWPADRQSDQGTEDSHEARTAIPLRA